MRENIVEPEIIVFEVEALVGAQEKTQARRDLSREAECENSDRSTQCFICSRIYFGQYLSRCPNCDSDSLLHYTTADLNHFARNKVREPL